MEPEEEDLGVRKLPEDDDDDDDTPLNVIAKKWQGRTGKSEDDGNQGQIPRGAGAGGDGDDGR